MPEHDIHCQILRIALGNQTFNAYLCKSATIEATYYTLLVMCALTFLDNEKINYPIFLAMFLFTAIVTSILNFLMKKYIWKENIPKTVNWCCAGIVEVKELSDYTEVDIGQLQRYLTKRTATSTQLKDAALIIGFSLTCGVLCGVIFSSTLYTKTEILITISSIVCMMLYTCTIFYQRYKNKYVTVLLEHLKELHSKTYSIQF